VFAILLLCCFTSPLFAQTELLPTSDFKNDTQSTLTIAMTAGLFVDIWRLWAEKTGRKIVFRLTSWAETMKALKLGEVDIHSGLFEAQNRAAWIRFSQPIYGVGIRIFFPLKRGNILTLRELVGKKVGVTRGSHVEGYVRERYPEVDVVAFRSVKEAIYATREGAIAAFVGVDPVISGILVRLGLQGEFDSAPEALYKRTFHAGVLRENVELLNVIDKGFNAISTNEVAKIEARWIPEPQKQYFKSGEKKLRLTPEERAWLVKHPKIDVGIMNNWPPMNYVDKKGIPRGIGVDYLDAINTQLGDVLNIIPAPFKENYDAVQAKRLDALMDITPKPDREPFFNFTKPYLTIPQIIVGQKNTTYLYGEKDLYGKTVALEHGYYTITRFKRDHPEIKIREYNSTSDCLDAVARGEVDAYVGNRAVAIYLIEKELIANLQTMGRTSEKPVPLVIGTRKDFPELAAILDKALASLSPQTIQDIHRKWAKRTDPMAKALVLTPEERAWLKEYPVITLTTLPDWQPFVITDDKTGELTGIDVEFIKLLNQRLGGAIKIETYDWKTLVQMSKDHKVDGFFPASITEDRKPYLVWTQVYNSTPLALVTLRDAPDIKEWRDLAGKKVVMTASSSYIELLGELAPEAEIAIVKNVEEQVPFLAEGKADAALNSAPVLYHTMRSNNVLTLMRFQKYYMSDNHGQFRIAIRNDKPLLLSILNKGIASITEEEFNAIKNKWIPIEVLAESSLKAAVELTEEEQSWLGAHPVIRLGGGIFPPLGGLDSAGEVEGIGRAYADLIAGRLGIRFEHSAGVWADVHKQAKRREIDVIRLLIPNEERDAYLNFTNAYTELGYGLVTHQSAKPVYALTELTGMRLAALKASYDHNLVAKQHPDIDLLSVDSYEAGIDVVFNRKADAFIGALAPIEYIFD
jgi:ABC-type amino acid transport substrate-binding protein